MKEDRFKSAKLAAKFCEQHGYDKKSHEYNFAVTAFQVAYSIGRSETANELIVAWSDIDEARDLLEDY